ncbi:ORF.38 [Pseudomonas phage PaP3]|uniref:ORF.38 n=2 Tax=Bruynoghevirus TaxID=545932 RepID=Q8H9V3_9CAUD|nr:ORF.38 [Pseudomonas phage PaP3]AAL85533.1 ORF.38 [Pseudomonas phage PaP3]UZV42283.1 putative membrane protein [Pseudomonas phage Ka1]
MKENWLYDAVKRALALSQEMLSGTEPAVRWKNVLDGNSDLTRWSITSNVLKMVAVTGILTSVSVATLLMLLMVVVLGIVRPKAFERKSK